MKNANLNSKLDEINTLRNKISLLREYCKALTFQMLSIEKNQSEESAVKIRVSLGHEQKPGHHKAHLTAQEVIGEQGCLPSPQENERDKKHKTKKMKDFQKKSNREISFDMSLEKEEKIEEINVQSDSQQNGDFHQKLREMHSKENSFAFDNKNYFQKIKENKFAYIKLAVVCLTILLLCFLLSMIITTAKKSAHSSVNTDENYASFSEADLIRETNLVQPLPPAQNGANDNQNNKVTGTPSPMPTPVAGENRGSSKTVAIPHATAGVATKDEENIEKNAILKKQEANEIAAKSAEESRAARLKSNEKSGIEESDISVGEETEKSAVKPSNASTFVEGEVIVLHAKPEVEIEISRSKKFTSIYMHGKTNKHGKIQFSTPPAGQVYWREAGENDIKTIEIIAQKTESIKLNSASQMSISQTLSWNTDREISFYRIEASSDGDHIEPEKVFSTTSNSLPARSIGKGKWYVQISAFDLKSGKWISSKIKQVTIK